MVRSTAGATLELSHQVIMAEQETCGAADLPLDNSALWAHRAEDAIASDEEDEEGAQWVDSVGELPSLPAVRSWTRIKPEQLPGHVVLMLDTSGSMRVEDVVQSDAGADRTFITRLEAVCACAVQFLEQHSRLRPQDRFSIVTFDEEATLVSRQLDAAATHVALQGHCMRGANGTHYKPALEAAVTAFATGTSNGACDAVLLSDGRPADTKVALEFFQAKILKGKPFQLHGIGFGGTVQSFEALQQLVCLSGGAFVLSNCSIKGLCDAFASVSSSITSLSSHTGAGTSIQHVPRIVDFEMPSIGAFGKRGVLSFDASRSTFRYDGVAFHRETWPVGSVDRRIRPHMRGGMRLVYGFRDRLVVAENESWMVAKSSRFVDSALNSKAVVESHVKSTAVARHYAIRFNERLQGRFASIFFVPCFLYDRAVGIATEPLVFAAERYLPGVFLKYTSNNGYVNDDVRHFDVVQAFTHFTFASSGGCLLVADLQGVARDSEVLLTDPQVLSVEGQFGPGDLGGKGVRACLAVHRCGPACKALGLAPLSSALRQLGARPAQPGTSSEWEKISSHCSSGFEKVAEHRLTGFACSEGERSYSESSCWGEML